MKLLESLIHPLKTFWPNFIAFFVFSDIASSCILRISHSETLTKREYLLFFFLPESLFIHSVGGKLFSLAGDSKPIRSLETPRSLSVYIIVIIIIHIGGGLWWIFTVP